MEKYTLPQDLGGGTWRDVGIHDYRVFEDTRRSKVELTHYVFSFLQEGMKEIITDQQAVSIAGGEFLILKAGNCLMTEKISLSQQHYHSLLLFFSESVLLNFWERHQLQMPSQSPAQSYLVCAYDDYLRHFVSGLQQIRTFPPDRQADLLALKCEEVFLYLAQTRGVKFLGSLLQKEDEKTLRLRNVVEYNKLNKLSLQELAFLCSMSLSTFKREFQKQYQASPSKWFQEQRLDHAAFLLLRQQKRPVEVFESAGYENFTNFVQAFKRKFGQTPKQYQKGV